MYLKKLSPNGQDKLQSNNYKQVFNMDVKALIFKVFLIFPWAWCYFYTWPYSLKFTVEPQSNYVDLVPEVLQSNRMKEDYKKIE